MSSSQTDLQRGPASLGEVGAGSFGALVGAGAAAALALVWGASGVEALRAAGGTALWLVPVAAGVRLGRPWLRRAGVVSGLAVGPLAVLAALVKAETHHRPLGAAAFAVSSLVASAAALAVAARLEVAQEVNHGIARRRVRAIRRISIGVSLGLLGLVAARPPLRDLLGALLGPALLAVLGAFAAFGPVPRSAARRWPGLFGACVLVALASAFCGDVPADAAAPRLLYGLWGLG